MPPLLRLAYPVLTSVLFLSACKKEEPQPEPTLEGRWDYTAVVSTTYTATGTQLTQHTTTYPVDNSVNAAYVTFTSTTIQNFYGTGAAAAPPDFYTRTGSLLSFSRLVSGASTPVPVGTATITQLTASNLTLLYTVMPQPPATDYLTFEQHFTPH